MNERTIKICGHSVFSAGRNDDLIEVYDPAGILAQRILVDDLNEVETYLLYDDVTLEEACISFRYDEDGMWHISFTYSAKQRPWKSLWNPRITQDARVSDCSPILEITADENTRIRRAAI